LQSTLLNGGPRALAWGILIVAAGALAQSASLAEMSSAQPIAGAQYVSCLPSNINPSSTDTGVKHWTHALAPAKQRRFITWMQGWVTWFAWVSVLAGVANTSAYMLQSLIAANNPEYVPEAFHVTLIIFALLIFMGLMNMFTWFLIPWFELAAGILHIVLFVIFVVVFVTLSPRKSADFVFLRSASQTGWNNPFISFNLGLMTPTWGFVGKPSLQLRQASECLTILICNQALMALVSCLSRCGNRGNG